MPIPRDAQDDYTGPMAQRRREFVAERTGARLEHVAHHSILPAQVAGNVENFLGVAQVPIGLAGPLRILGEHAQGTSTCRSRRRRARSSRATAAACVLSESGGVTVTVVKHSMQRAPVFRFRDAREARDFGQWLVEQFQAIKGVAESTTRVGKLLDIEQYALGNLLYTRFNYTTGDAAGQNMTGKATWAACEWIQAQHPLRPRYILSGSMDTDKKHSAINTLRTRGKRVIAECTIRNEVIQRLMRVDTQTLFRARQISTAGSIMAGSAYNGPHAANGITAMFIATGQDVANVAESHAGITYAQLLDNGDTTGRSPCRH